MVKFKCCSSGNVILLQDCGLLEPDDVVAQKSKISRVNHDDIVGPNRMSIEGEYQALLDDMIDTHSDNMSDAEYTHIGVLVERAVRHNDIHADISP